MWKLVLLVFSSKHLTKKKLLLITIMKCSNHKSKITWLTSGFTLIELTMSLSITAVVVALSLQTLSSTQKEFTADTRNIEKSQRRSSVLEVIGRDIRQAGEQIEEARFPVIKMFPNSVPAKGDNLVLYRAATAPLPLCNKDPIPANTNITEWFMSSDDPTVTNSNQECRANAIEAPKIYPINLDEWVSNKASNPFGVISSNDGRVQPFIYTDQFETAPGSKAYKIKNTLFNNSFELRRGQSAYLVEKKEYLVCGDDLLMRLNSPEEGECPTNLTESQFQTIASNVDEMKVKIYLPKLDGATGVELIPPQSQEITDAFPPVYILPAVPPILQQNYYWKSIQLVNITIKSKKFSDDVCTGPTTVCAERDQKLVAESSFYPRNVMSSKAVVNP
jgi:prepilin-type N-terminal cleavage/methylation domain-containing protein